MRIKDLATRATKLLTGNAYMVFDNGTKVEKVDYAELAKQIITEYNTQTLAGSAQSVKSALDALNSNMTNQIQSMKKLTSPALLTDTISPGYYYVTEATDIPTGASSSNGYLRVYGRESNLSILKVMEYRPFNSTDTYVNMKKGNESWSGWEKLPTRAEMDALNSKLTFSRINSGTINDPSEYPQGVYVQYVAGTVTGAPLDSAGVVITFSWADWYVVQLACVGSAMVWRNYSSGAWSNWTAM